MVSLLQPLAARWRVSASVLLALVGITLGTVATLVLHVVPPIASEDFLYIFLPLPMGLAYGRARLEWEAYAETIRAAAEVYGKTYPAGQQFRAHVVEQFLGPSYGWMWPFRRSVERWYDRELARL